MSKQRFPASRVEQRRGGEQPLGNGARQAVWRADTAHVRWLILGALGVASACGGQAGEPVGGTGSEGASLEVGACAEPRTDLGGGFERCGDGTVHRASTSLCSSELPRPRSLAPQSGMAEAYDICTQDSDCAEAPHGACNYDVYFGGNWCFYGCISDDECAAGSVCRCGSPVGYCEEASCRTDADCAAGLLCTEYEKHPGCPGQAMACQTAADECSSDNDCSDSAFCTVQSWTGPHRVCGGSACDVGRPFLVAGAARLAPLEARADWYTATADALPAPGRRVSNARLRAALADGWVQQGLMEHASVAAFARFSLQLISLAAPPELLSGAASAMLDEIRHARGCFELARRFSEGSHVGPGALPLEGALESTDLTAIVLGTLAEGCIGETVAALEAAEVLMHTEDAAARALLEQIAKEEAAHAQLAWRFLAWALETGPASLREQVASAFDAELAAAHEPPEKSADPALDAELLRHGLANATLRQALRVRVLRDVVGPCAAALLAQPSRPRAAPRGDTFASARA